MRFATRKTSSVPPSRRGEGERLYWLAGQTAVLLLLCALPVLAQVESFRARIVLLPGGTVSISVDNGAHFTTIGRVLSLPQKINSSQLPARTATIQRKGLWLMQYNEQHSIALAAAGVASVSALHTDIPPESVLFRPLEEGASAQLLYQEGRIAFSLPPGYRYRVGDVWVLRVVAADEGQAQRVREVVAAALPGEGQSAVQRSLLRAEREKLPVVRGMLNLEVTARYAERVQFVFLTVDGYPVGTSNVLPTIFRWDSTQVADGEYVLEARAVDTEGRELALVRRRVLVRNGAGTPR
ncbi:MAG: hypothetical protein NZ520_01645 [bacterium]|nr:hypothetical protein [bacterium]